MRSRGKSFFTILTHAGIVPGIKVDIGAKPLAGRAGETVTERLDGLRERLHEYSGMGACFAKWRAVSASARQPAEVILRSTWRDAMVAFASPHRRYRYPLTPAWRGVGPCANDHLSLAHVWTSPHRRARETCHLAGCTAQAQIEPDIAECDHGAFGGLRSDEIRTKRPGWRIFRDGCPDGETPSKIFERIDRVSARVRALGEDVALFSHGQFGAAFAARWIGPPALERRHLTLGPASISVLSYDLDHPETPILALWNVAPALI